jgi:predicted ATP-grasp superfamily ATP-dependent carboligase
MWFKDRGSLKKCLVRNAGMRQRYAPNERSVWLVQSTGEAMRRIKKGGVSVMKKDGQP